MTRLEISAVVIIILHVFSEMSAPLKLLKLRVTQVKFKRVLLVSSVTFIFCVPVEGSQFSGQFAGWAPGGSSLPAAPSGVLRGDEAAGA